MLFQGHGGFVHHDVQQAIHDLGRRERPLGRNRRLDLLIHSLSPPSLVAVEPQLGLLPQLARRDQAIDERGGGQTIAVRVAKHVRDLARDVEPDLIQKLERSHRHSEIPESMIHRAHRLSSLHQRDRLSEIRHQHAIHEESGRVRDQDRSLPQASRERDHRLDRGRVADVGADHLDQRHPGRGIEEVHSDHAPGIPEPLRHRAHDPLQLAEERLLHRKVLDHRLQRQVRGLETGEIERRLDARERLLHLGLREAAARDLALEEGARMREGAKQGLGLQISKAGADVPAREEIGDLSSHGPRSHDGDVGHLAGARGLGLALRLLAEREDAAEVLRFRREEKLRHRLPLHLEPRLGRGAPRGAQDADDLQRRGIMPARLPEHVPPRLRENAVPDGRHGFHDAHRERRAAAFHRRQVLQQRFRRLNRALGEALVRQHRIDQADPVRAAAVQRAPREQEIERGHEPDEPRQTLGSSESRQDPQLHLREPDREFARVGGDPIAHRQRQLRAAAQAGPVDGGDRDVGKVGNLLEELLGFARLGPGFGGILEPVELGDVRARDELLLLGAQQHERARIGAVAPLPQRLEHAAERRERFRVEKVDLAAGIVEPEERDSGRVTLQAEGTVVGAAQLLFAFPKREVHHARSRQSTRKRPAPAGVTPRPPARAPRPDRLRRTRSQAPDARPASASRGEA